MIVFADGLEREHRRFHLLFQLENDTGDTGLELTDARCGDKRIVGFKPGGQLFQFTAKYRLLQINDQPVRLAKGEHCVVDLVSCLYREARVIRGWPDTNSSDAGIGKGGASLPSERAYRDQKHKRRAQACSEQASRAGAQICN